jgi:hypothetical protein
MLRVAVAEELYMGANPGRGLTRREMLRNVGLAAGSVSAASILGACQSKAGKAGIGGSAPSQPAAPIDRTAIHPKVISDVLVNPGIGFMTFQRFNGDSLNQG